MLFGFRILRLLITAGLLIGLLPNLATARAETVALPLTIDYPLLRALIVQHAFRGPGETAVVLDEDGGCRRIVVSTPAYRQERALVRLTIKVEIFWGTSLGDGCVVPVEWEGYVVLYQQPYLDPQWRLNFETIDSAVYDRHYQPAKIMGLLWELINTRVYAHLDAIRIDLAPPVKDMQAVLRAVLPNGPHTSAEKMLASMRPGQVQTTASAIRFDVLAEVEVRPAAPPAQMPSDQQLAQMTANWEMWDVYLVYLVTSLPRKALTGQERMLVVATLLDVRHQFAEAMLSRSVSHDLVRRQFVMAWKHLSPVFRSHLGQTPSPSLTGYLAFFTASDALVALDRIGPALGIEISRDGLLRLAKLLGRRDPLNLAYHRQVDALLRELMQLGPEPLGSGPVFDGEELELDRPVSNNHTGHLIPQGLVAPLGLFLVPPAWAKQKTTTPSLAEIKKWLTSASSTPAAYLERIKGVLSDSALKTLKQRQTASGYRTFFPVLVLATAWQESCLRQFVVNKRKIVYLRSYNGSSVGLMQVNERVWRGFYDLNRLRWDIRYNALSGCEILDLYVTKYIEPKLKTQKLKGKLKEQTLAQLIYALYNGGPGQFSKFFKRKQEGKLYDSDKLFTEKYNWVQKGQWRQASKCWGT